MTWSPTPKPSASTTEPLVPTVLVAVLDADVLVPILTCDLLLSAFDHDLYQPVITSTILDEVGRSLRTDFARLDPAAVDRRVGQVAAALAQHTHAVPTGTETVERVNAKDRHIAAVALATKANLVVTNDTKLRRQLGDLDPPMAASTVDDFALQLFRSHPDQVRDVLGAMAAKRRNPPITVDGLVQKLGAGLPRFAAEITSS